MKSLVMCLTLAGLAAPAMADPAEVVEVRAQQQGREWRFDVALLHPDTGWDDYADAWQVLAPDGTVLGTRELAHPHVNEQPFTRSLSGVVIPDGITEVGIRARTNVDGWSETIVTFELPL